MESSQIYIKDFYHKHSKKHKITARILTIVSYLPSFIIGKKILDVGCGNELLTTCMKVYADVDGIDIDEDILKYESDIKYDVVTCFDVFEHLTDVPKAIEQVKKLCKPGGLILVNQPEQQDPKQPIDNLVTLRELMDLGKLVFLDNYSVFKNESYFFMVFVR